MSTYVLSDIHGCMDQYHSMLEKTGFCDTDELYVIGDVIDRGAFGAELLCEIMDAPNVHLLMGNHEFMMLQALLKDDYSSWDLNHNEPTIAGLLTLDQEKVVALLQYVLSSPYSLDLTVGGRKFELVHACPPEMCADNRFDMVWERVGVEDIEFEDRTVIFGHTPTCMITGSIRDSHILTGEHAMNIDCGCVYGGKLACVRLDDMEVFYVDGPRVDLTDY